MSEINAVPAAEPEEHSVEQIFRRIPAGRRKMRPLSMRVRVALSLGLCVATVLCRVLWPDCASGLRRWIVGDGSEQVQQAFFRMEAALEEGDGLGEAWTAFCAGLTDETA